MIWRELPSYRDCSPGETFAPFFFDHFKGEITSGQTISDFGCGTGRVAKEFIARGLHVSLVDISPFCLDEEIRSLVHLFSDQIHFVQACLWQLPNSLAATDWVYMCDVLEHIPEEKVDDVLLSIASKMKRGGYFSICLKEDLAGQAIGQTLHLSVREKGWWEEKLSAHFTIRSVDAVADELYFNCAIGPRAQKKPLAT